MMNAGLAKGFPGRERRAKKAIGTVSKPRQKTEKDLQLLFLNQDGA